MRQRRYYILLFVTLSAMLPLATLVRGLGGVTLSAFTGASVNIDGVNSPSEWFDSRHLSYNWAWSNASLTGGGDLWVKNDGTNLLVAVETNGRAQQTQGMDTYLYTLYLLFDNDNNGFIDSYEDGKAQGFTTQPSPFLGSPIYRDLNYNTTQGLYVDDRFTDGVAAGSHSNPGGVGRFTWEFSIPMTSPYTDDFALAVNASIGFQIIYAEYNFSGPYLVGSGYAYWEVSYTNGLPSGPSPSANGWAVIVRTNSQAPISDNTPPTISTPTIQPPSPGPGGGVMISVVVTDSGSGVKNVSITYTTDNWKSVNTTLIAVYSSNSQLAVVQIPALQGGGRIAYYVVAFDNAGNRAVNNNSGTYFSYDVVAPFYLKTWFYAALAAALGLFLFAAVYLTRRKRIPKSLQPTGSG